MTPICKILIAGDPNLRKNLAEEFAAAPEFSLVEAASLADAREYAVAHAPDVLLIDDDFASPDARSAITGLRDAGFTGPILLLASKTQKVEAQDCACLARPFRFSDLLARLRLLLRRRERKQDEIFSIGPYCFRPLSGELTCGESVRLRLTGIESAILARLSRACGECVSRDILLRDVWGYNPTVTTRTLETHIHRLRRKMESNPAKPSLLVTEANGYRVARDGMPMAAPTTK
jgi:DNA-binding response OmpR family regulator